MANWEFFLQTKGEENWLRLTSTQPDIPSGYYRIVARAPHHAHELIEVQIKTRQKQETLTRTQKQQHSCQLDQDGFGVLADEIELIPGFWEIQCRRELMNAFTQPDWENKLCPRVTLQLEKAARKGELATLPKEENIEKLRSRLIQNADQILEEVVSDVFSDIDSTLPSAPLSEPSSKKWRGIFPPQLVSKHKKKKRISPQLPNLPNTVVREKKRKPKKEYVWSKPDDKVAEEPKTLEWELIPELVITSEDTNT